MKAAQKHRIGTGATHLNSNDSALGAIPLSSAIERWENEGGAPECGDRSRQETSTRRNSTGRLTAANTLAENQAHS
jgi:hypothetical protein